MNFDDTMIGLELTLIVLLYFFNLISKESNNIVAIWITRSLAILSLVGLVLLWLALM